MKGRHEHARAVSRQWRKNILLQSKRPETWAALFIIKKQITKLTTGRNTVDSPGVVVSGAMEGAVPGSRMSTLSRPLPPFYAAQGFPNRIPPLLASAPGELPLLLVPLIACLGTRIAPPHSHLAIRIVTQSHHIWTKRHRFKSIWRSLINNELCVNPRRTEANHIPSFSGSG